MNATTSGTPLADADDAALACAATTSQHAFAELYRRHAVRVYRYVLAQTGHVQDAEDVTTQTFMHAMGGYFNVKDARDVEIATAWQ